MSPSPYLTPPPTVPVTRHPSVTRSTHPATTVPTIPAPSSIQPRMNLPSIRPPPNLPLTPYHPYYVHPTPSPYYPLNSFANPLHSPAFPHPSYRPSYPTSIPLSAISTIRKIRDELDDSPPASPNPRAEKRRRTRKPAGAGGDKQASPSAGSAAGGQSPSSADAPVTVGPGGQEQQRRTSGMGPAPIKPIGFAASRENRRESGGIVGEPAVPSPVVMGFDFQKVDEDQLKTVS